MKTLDISTLGKKIVPLCVVKRGAVFCFGNLREKFCHTGWEDPCCNFASSKLKCAEDVETPAA